ncbi:Citrate/oxoglutarate carrier protein [Colletotrichum sp. SAR 10_70]|nr:Citrate/oxoglutarate carrier protein [Colletotrichum sp. SAR 10_71]KAI8197392.1 Citrate/oxoglutarate carrier protein [Colletotrichum sp. SAR 10_70]KAI8247744.1 Citrate/oxoglutarate carrier protein [Colletotrichum sp. SAR 10_77]
MATSASAAYAPTFGAVEKRKTPWRNLMVGACMNVIQVTTLGQPMEVIKTHAWLEASTKGAILVLTSTEVEYYAKRSGLGTEIAGVLGGIVGGASQAYLTMAGRTPGTMEVFLQILRTKGIRGVNRGVNAVALRQITGWSSRIGISRVAEGQIKSFRGKSPEEKLAPPEKIVASIIGAHDGFYREAYLGNKWIGWIL